MCQDIFALDEYDEFLDGFIRNMQSEPTQQIYIPQNIYTQTYSTPSSTTFSISPSSSSSSSVATSCNSSSNCSPTYSNNFYFSTSQHQQNVNSPPSTASTMTSQQQNVITSNSINQVTAASSIIKANATSPHQVTSQSHQTLHHTVQTQVQKNIASSFLFNNQLLYPKFLGLQPEEEWTSNEPITLQKLIEVHFRARSTRKLRFEHKLWNALTLTLRFPELESTIGVCWISESIIKVNRDVFGHLLGLTRPTASLFNPQGSFQSHGFLEVSEQNLCGDNDRSRLDESAIRYFTHASRNFNFNSPASNLLSCKWKSRVKSE